MTVAQQSVRQVAWMPHNTDENAPRRSGIPSTLERSLNLESSYASPEKLPLRSEVACSERAGAGRKLAVRKSIGKQRANLSNRRFLSRSRRRRRVLQQTVENRFGFQD